MKRWWVAIFVIALALTAAFWAVRRFRPPGAMTVIESQAMDMTSMKPPPGAMPVGTATVQRSEIGATVTYSGSVVALADQNVVARVTGRVEDVPVYPGDRVIPGQLLVRLDSAELSSRVQEAEAAVAESRGQVLAKEAEWRSRAREQKATAASVAIGRNEIEEAHQMTRAAREQVAAAEAEFRRTETLLNEGGASLQELQQNRAELADARARYNASRLTEQRAALSVRRTQAEVEARHSQTAGASSDIEAARASAQLREAQLRTARIQLSYTEMRATAPAEVVERVVSPGTLVSPGEVVLRLKQSGQVRLQVPVEAGQASRIRPGFPVIARVGEKTFATKVSALFRSADPKTRSVTVEARVKPAPELVPGAAVQMQVALEKPSSKLSIPVGALQVDAQGARYVWKLAAEAGQGPPVYTCVMHPEVLRSAPGKCPKCGMDLIPKQRGGPTVVVRQPVHAGAVAGDRVVILGGLKQGEEIVVQGVQALRDGMAVTRVRWGPTGPLELPSPAAAPTNDPHAGHR